MIDTAEAPAEPEQMPALATVRPDGLVGLRLGRREMEIYLHLVREPMTAAEILAAQHRAVEIVRAHDKVGAWLARNDRVG